MTWLWLRKEELNGGQSSDRLPQKSMKGSVSGLRFLIYQMSEEADVVH